MKTIGLIALAVAGLGIGYLVYTDRGQELMDRAGDAASDAADTVRESAQQAMDSAKQTIGKTTESAQQTIGEGISSMKRSMSDTTERVTSAFGMDGKHEAQEMVADVVHQPHPDTAMAHAFEEALAES